MRNILIFSILIITSCEYFQHKEKTHKKVVATVGDKKLLESSFLDLIPPNLSVTDSSVFVEKFILDWIKKQLMISRAEEAIDFNEAQIQKKVLDYQYALMVHEFEKKFIDANLNDNISNSEIEEYYQSKSENFILRQNLVKCIYFKILTKTPNIWKFKRDLLNYPKDLPKMWEYVNKHAIKAFVEDSVWIKFDEVLLEIPLKDSSDNISLLKSNNLIEISDEGYTYFLRIFEYKVIGEITPLEFIKGNIFDIIINKRKIILKKKLEKKIYEEAERTNAFEIYHN